MQSVIFLPREISRFLSSELILFTLPMDVCQRYFQHYFGTFVIQIASLLLENPPSLGSPVVRSHPS